MAINSRAGTHTPPSTRDFASNCARGNTPGQRTRRTGVCARNHDLTVVGVLQGLRPSGTTYTRCRACNDLRVKATRMGVSVKELV